MTGARVGVGQRVRAVAVGAIIVTLLACAMAAPAAFASPEGIHKIQHVVVIMQENRSFDSYFGTFPGANGIPAEVCVPNPTEGGCVKPFHDGEDKNDGGPHGTSAAIADIDGGKMDGFIEQAQGALGCTETGGCSKCKGVPECGVDVVGYHDAREIPNYWSYAKSFALDDDMFASSASWSLPEHLYMVSGWSALCAKVNRPTPLECTNSLSPKTPARGGRTRSNPGAPSTPGPTSPICCTRRG